MSALRLLPLALRNLLRHPRRTVVSSLVIGFGVTALMCAASFSQAFLEFMRDRIIDGRIGAIQVHRKGYVAARQSATLALTLPGDEAFRQRLLAVPGVRGASARIVFSGLVSSARTQTIFVARAFDDAHEREVCPQLWSNVAKGRFETGASVLPGAGLLKGLKVSVGERLMLSATSAHGRVNAVPAVVTGAAGDVMALESRNVLTVPLALARELTGLDGEVTEYGVSVKDGARLDEVVSALEAELGPQYEVHAWTKLVPYLSDGLYYMRWLIAFIGTLLALVVASSVTNALMMGVYERGREIGTQLAVGMRRRDVRVLFLLEAAALGVGAAALGVGIGALLVALLGWVGVPASFMGSIGGGVLRPGLDLTVAGIAALGAVMTSTLAGVWPAVRASRLRPVDALAGR